MKLCSYSSKKKIINYKLIFMSSIIPKYVHNYIKLYLQTLKLEYVFYFIFIFLYYYISCF